LGARNLKSKSSIALRALESSIFTSVDVVPVFFNRLSRLSVEAFKANRLGLEPLAHSTAHPDNFMSIPHPSVSFLWRFRAFPNPLARL
jgi:hypothetical protein